MSNSRFSTTTEYKNEQEYNESRGDLRIGMGRVLMLGAYGANNGAYSVTVSFADGTISNSQFLMEIPYHKVQWELYKYAFEHDKPIRVTIDSNGQPMVEISK